MAMTAPDDNVYTNKALISTYLPCPSHLYLPLPQPVLLYPITSPNVGSSGQALKTSAHPSITTPTLHKPSATCILCPPLQTDNATHAVSACTSIQYRPWYL